MAQFSVLSVLLVLYLSAFATAHILPRTLSSGTSTSKAHSTSTSSSSRKATTTTTSRAPEKTTTSTTFKSTTTTKTTTVKSTSTPIPNLLINGDFETGTDSSWYISSTQDDGANYKVTTPHSTDTVGSPGKYMLELIVPNNTMGWPFGATLSQGFDTVPGKNYSISYDFHFGGDGQLRLCIDEDKGCFGTYSSAFSGWKHATGHFTANGLRSHFNIAFWTIKGVGLWDFDNLVVQPVQ